MIGRGGKDFHMTAIISATSTIPLALTIHAAISTSPDITNPASPDTTAAANGAATSDVRSSDPGRIDAWMQDVSSYNVLADFFGHFNFALMEKLVGTEKATEGQANQAAQGSRLLQAREAHLTRESWGLAVSTPVLSNDQTRVGSVAGPLFLNNFSFNSNGSTYTVTTGKDGTMVGTKDGKAWKTWQVTPPAAASHAALSAETALSTMKALTEKLLTQTVDQNSLMPLLDVRT
jgi:hypothetical protein